MPTLGVIVGNRNFFPDHLCETGRQTVLDVLEKEGITAVIPPEDATNCGRCRPWPRPRRSRSTWAGACITTRPE